jgi:spore coat protein U-like protein
MRTPTMKKLIRTALFLALAAAPLSSAALGATATTTFNVTATIAAKCTIGAADLVFGAYDPLVTNLAVPLDVNSTVTVACTKGTAATVGLDAGQNSGSAVGTTRAMAGGGAFLSYEIYKDAAHTTVWGNAGAGLVAYTAASKAPATLIDYGRIPANQDQPVAGYADKITATINF